MEAADRLGEANRRSGQASYQYHRSSRATASIQIPRGASLPPAAIESEDARATGAEERHPKARCRSFPEGHQRRPSDPQL
jgi:hypothetical protein